MLGDNISSLLKLKWWIAHLVLVLTLCGFVRVVATGDDRTLPQVAPDHILVKFKSSATSMIKAVTPRGILNELRDALNLPAGAELFEPAINQILREKQVQQPGASVNQVNLDRFLYLRIPSGLTVNECVQRVKRYPWVEYAEPDGMGTGGLIPNDPNFSNQWHHKNNTKPSACIQTPLAWDITQGSTNVIVAVLDTGLTPSAEFTGRLVSGYNFVGSNTNTTDDHGHGTAVAGTVAANANNSNLVAGVDWYCYIMPIKVLDSNNSGLYSWWAQGIDFAVTNGAKVINLSAGGSSTSSTLTRAITNAIAQGAIFVTATHNDGTNVIRFPGNLTNCITVGATDAQDRRTSFSNYGPEIDLCAPGTNIYTVSRTGTLNNWWGTSFSTPQVAGVCALLASIRPGITHEQARLLLCARADDGVGDAYDTPGFDNYYGYGRLNAYNTLLLAQLYIDRINWTNNACQIAWQSPPNASNKQPFQIKFTTNLTGYWTTVVNTTAYVYTTNRTYWTDTNIVDNVRFYRVRIRPLP